MATGAQTSSLPIKSTIQLFTITYTLSETHRSTYTVKTDDRFYQNIIHKVTVAQV